jgi:6,7-dimethyl-8-ribityllumazine synthase
MIKGISFLRPVGSPEVYDRLASFFSALGFAPGKGWQEENSSGASFLAPLGNLEFVDGQFPSTADVLVEVTALDAVYQAAETWLRAQGSELAVARLSPVTDTHWKSRIFTVEPEPGFSFSFWGWSDPLRAKPIAVEGDLSASGMKFAIVVARWNAVITERLLDAARSALIFRLSAFPALGRFPRPPAPSPTRVRSTPSSRLVVCCAVKPPTTRPSITK